MRRMMDLVVAVQKSGRVYNRMMKETARQCGITKPAMDILLFLHNNPEYNKASDVSERRFLAKSYVSRAVDLLQKEGYLQVDMDPQDRRVLRLTPLEKADDIIAQGMETQERFSKWLYKNVSTEEMEEMHRIYSKIMVNLDEMQRSL